jgi:hypothetical protein
VAMVVGLRCVAEVTVEFVGLVLLVVAFVVEVDCSLLPVFFSRKACRKQNT